MNEFLHDLGVRLRHVERRHALVTRRLANCGRKADAEWVRKGYVWMGCQNERFGNGEKARG